MLRNICFKNAWKRLDGTGNYADSIKFTKVNLQNIYLILFPIRWVHVIRNTNNVPQFKVKDNFFRNSFFPSAVIEWNKLDLNICNSESLNILKKRRVKFIRHSGSSVFICHNLRGVKLLTRLRVGLSHLREHKLKRGFQDSLDPICSCVYDIKTSAHFLLHCPHYSNERSTFLNIIRNINRNDSIRTICKLLFSWW